MQLYIEEERKPSYSTLVFNKHIKASTTMYLSYFLKLSSCLSLPPCGLFWYYIYSDIKEHVINPLHGLDFLKKLLIIPRKLCIF